MFFGMSISPFAEVLGSLPKTTWGVSKLFFIFSHFSKFIFCENCFEEVVSNSCARRSYIIERRHHHSKAHQSQRKTNLAPRPPPSRAPSPHWLLICAPPGAVAGGATASEKHTKSPHLASSRAAPPTGPQAAPTASQNLAVKLVGAKAKQMTHQQPE